MRLPEDEECIFKLFVDWLYSQRYEMLPEQDYGDEDDDEEGGIDPFKQAYQLFVLAENYTVLGLKRLIIETLFADKFEWGPLESSIAYAYEFTTQGSGLRKMLADWHVWQCASAWFERQQIQAFLRQQPDFALDLCLSFANMKELGENHNPFHEEIMPKRYLD